MGVGGALSYLQGTPVGLTGGHHVRELCQVYGGVFCGGWEERCCAEMFGGGGQAGRADMFTLVKVGQLMNSTGLATYVFVDLLNLAPPPPDGLRQSLERGRQKSIFPQRQGVSGQ